MQKKLTPLFIFFIGLAISLVTGCMSSQQKIRKRTDEYQQHCWQKIKSAQANKDSLNIILDKEIFHYQEVVEELLVNREKSLRLIQAIDKTRAISSSDQDNLNNRMKLATSFLDRISDVIGRNACWLAADDERMQNLKLPALDTTLRLKGVMLSLSGSMILYDSYLTVIALLNENERIRRFLNQDDSGYGIQTDQLQTITDDFVSMENLAISEAEIEYYQHHQKFADSANISDTNFAYLDLLIQSSRAYKVIGEITVDELISQRLNNRNKIMLDNLTALNRQAVNNVSELFGNLLGVVETRQGKLYADSKTENLVLSQLQPGDILLEKTPFRLTDKIIPGHWGHAAVWIGNEQQLTALGTWETPLVRKYHTAIQNQQLVVEALRDGTQMNTLRHFLNVDDLVILRAKNLTDQQRARIIEITLRQVGKPYDFNYDIETTDKIVCSQLVYLAYTQTEWPTKSIAGRYTISPDNIAVKAINEGPLEIIMFYHDGHLVADDPIPLLQTLMQQ